MTDLIVISLERWDEVWRRNQHLVAGLLRADPSLRVLFVEPPDDPLHAVLSQARPEFGHPVRRVGERLWTYRPVKWLPRRIDNDADERAAHRIMHAARHLRMARPALWINDPGAADISRMTGWPTLYDITDDWLAADRPDREKERTEAGEVWLLAYADVVVACSAEIVRRKSRQRPDIRLVPNAVDLDAYRAPHPRPADLPKGCVALYLGTLHRDRLDVDLCVETANALAGRGSVVLVGPDSLAAADSDRLRDAGIVSLGPRSREQVIGYLQHADVLLVPHGVTAFTESLDPLKLYEYQAAARPIVSTPVAGFRDAAGVIVSDPAGFPDAVLTALGAEVSAPAELPDWSQRVESMRALLSGMNSDDVD